MFKFRLQRILELREQKEKAQARELASAQHTAELAVQTQEMLAALREDSRQQVQAATGAAPRVGHLHQLGSVLDALDARLTTATEEVAAADATVQAAQQLLEAAARERKVLDRLKSRHADAWRTDEAQKDRISMDEIALTRFTRQHDAAADAAKSADAAATPTDGSAR
jgi:flagellar FliJ protein